MSHVIVAPNDGVTDATSAVQDQLVAGDCFLPAGRYLVDTLTLPSGLCLRGEGSSTQLLQATDTGGHHTLIPAANAADIALVRLSFVGAGLPTGNTYAVAVGNNGPVTRLSVKECLFTGYSGAGVQFGASGGCATDCSAQDSYFSGCGINIAQPCGVTIANASGFHLRDLIIDQPGDDRSFLSANFGIDCEPNTDADVIQDGVIMGVDLRNCGSGGIQVLARETAPNQTCNITILGCAVHGIMGDGILIQRARLVQTRSSLIHDNGRFGWRSFGPDNTLEGCSLVDNNRMGSASGFASLESGALDCAVRGNRIGAISVAQPPGTAAVIEQGSGVDRNQVAYNGLHSDVGVPLSVVLIGPNSQSVGNMA